MSTCQNCRHADRRHKEMLAQGFARCHLLPKWEFHSRTYVCSKWQAKE